MSFTDSYQPNQPDQPVQPWQSPDGPMTPLGIDQLRNPDGVIQNTDVRVHGIEQMLQAQEQGATRLFQHNLTVARNMRASITHPQYLGRQIMQARQQNIPRLLNDLQGMKQRHSNREIFPLVEVLFQREASSPPNLYSSPTPTFVNAFHTYTIQLDRIYNDPRNRPPPTSSQPRTQPQPGIVQPTTQPRPAPRVTPQPGPNSRNQPRMGFGASPSPHAVLGLRPTEDATKALEARRNTLSGRMTRLIQIIEASQQRLPADRQQSARRSIDNARERLARIPNNSAQQLNALEGQLQTIEQHWERRLRELGAAVPPAGPAVGPPANIPDNIRPNTLRNPAILRTREGRQLQQLLDRARDNPGSMSPVDMKTLQNLWNMLQAFDREADVQRWPANRQEAPPHIRQLSREITNWQHECTRCLMDPTYSESVRTMARADLQRIHALNTALNNVRSGEFVPISLQGIRAAHTHLRNLMIRDAQTGGRSPSPNPESANTARDAQRLLSDMSTRMRNNRNPISAALRQTHTRILDEYQRNRFSLTPQMVKQWRDDWNAANR